jgi:hypothetical protein
VLDEDTYRPAPFLSVLPVSALVLGVGLLLARGVPGTAPWTSTVSPHAGQAERRVDRGSELRLAIGELRALVLELRAGVATGARPERWQERLGLTLTRWQLYGETGRYRGFDSAEVGIAAVLQDLASLHYQLDGSLSQQSALDAIDRLLARLDRIEESLPDVD